MSLQEPLVDGSEPEGWFTFEEVLQQEREKMEELRNQRGKDEEAAEPCEKFSLAFSGGGIRAAAFQAGVLWRLAELNRLKDVEYFTAVSGGGYITSAFASHCLAAEPPASGDVKRWYQDVVAKTITRMQNNAGDFVRDCVKVPGHEYEGDGVLPRVFDLPILLVTLAATLMVNPITFIVIFVVPTTINIQVYFGAAMRAAFCIPPGAQTSWWHLYWEFSSFPKLLNCTGAVVIISTVVFFLTKLLPSCQLIDRHGQRPKATAGYLIGHAANACLVRLSVSMVLLIAFLYLVPYIQTASYDDASRVRACAGYISNATRGVQRLECADVYSSSLSSNEVWYQNSIFHYYEHPSSYANLSSVPRVVAGSGEAALSFELVSYFFNVSIIYKFFALWFLFLTFSVCVMPVFGSKLLVDAIIVSGPMLFLVLLVAFVQFCVFGPITLNKQGIMHYSRDRWENFASGSLLVAFFLMPFYEELRSALHVYYKRCLQKNYFANGKDLPFTKLAEHPYCPFVILTGTSSDFQPPGDHDVISELSFSALHTGSEETGYIHMPDYRSLAKCTALTGAGCLDAISLSMNETLALRFYLEVLNLSWGDYILFTPKNSTYFLNHCVANITSDLSLDWKPFAVRFLYRLPAGTCWFLSFIWLYIAWAHQRSSTSPASCHHSQDLLKLATFCIVGLLCLSFFGSLPAMDWLSLSPLLRQFQQATKYFYVGRRPPSMLYVTDGGVKDCTSLLQLMRRRCKRILLVLAAADPHDDLAVLKTAMEVAKELKIGSFYDPEDPRRDLSVVMGEYKANRSLPYLHLGISYCWPGKGEEASFGHLYIVKNRLPEEFEGQAVQPLLMEDDVRGVAGGTTREVSPQWGDLTSDKLGPFGCCDCCHTAGLNCGPKFPHGSFTGYMYLSPQWSNSLTRLGHAVSKPAIEKITTPESLSARWEVNVL